MNLIILGIVQYKPRMASCDWCRRALPEAECKGRRLRCHHCHYYWDRCAQCPQQGKLSCAGCSKELAIIVEVQCFRHNRPLEVYDVVRKKFVCIACAIREPGNNYQSPAGLKGPARIITDGEESEAEGSEDDEPEKPEVGQAAADEPDP